MPYITSVERIGIKKGFKQGFEQGFQEGIQMGREAVQQGIQQGIQLGIFEVLEERFGDIPPSISDDIRQIEDRSRLRTLHRQAIRSASIDDFRQQLRDQTNG